MHGQLQASGLSPERLIDRLFRLRSEEVKVGVPL